MTKLIIYGAGERGRGLLFLLRYIGVSVDCFCQTEVKAGLFVEGIPVISFADLLNMEGTLTVFIAIGDKNVSKNIRLRLSAIFLEQAV